MKKYRILKPVTLGFLTPQSQFDVTIDPKEQNARLESDGHTIWVVTESITMAFAIKRWLEEGRIVEIPE